MTGVIGGARGGAVVGQTQVMTELMRRGFGDIGFAAAAQVIVINQGR